MGGPTGVGKPRRVSFSLPTATDDTTSLLCRRPKNVGVMESSTVVCYGPTQPIPRAASGGAFTISARTLCGVVSSEPSSLTSQTFIRRRLCGLRSGPHSHDPSTPSTGAGGAFVTTGRRPVGVSVFGVARGVVAVLCCCRATAAG